ncbi:hypothetical protein [Chitinimonas koreensis]|uniref:hypothetical protein n=1 Tax=Chitinimonas koreensis TaxID=356302 RepID=UPI0004014269|nr:hypothetical protein [Chitinimonas koreensis]QNM97665.1 cupin [Chitinimonas koreensis]
MDNLFTDLPAAVPDEIFTTLMSQGGVRIERIVSDGQATPAGRWYDQDDWEWVLLLEGEAGLRFEDEAADRALRRGDYLPIAPHRRHRVTFTAPRTVWLAVWWPAEPLPS